MDYDDLFIYDNIINHYNLDIDYNYHIKYLQDIHEYHQYICTIDTYIKNINLSVKQDLQKWKLIDSSKKKKLNQYQKILQYISKYITILKKKKKDYLSKIENIKEFIKNNETSYTYKPILKSNQTTNNSTQIYNTFENKLENQIEEQLQEELNIINN